MKIIISISMCILFSLLSGKGQGQDSGRLRGLIMNIFNVKVTCFFWEGNPSSVRVMSDELAGLFGWANGTLFRCTPSNGICKVESITGYNLKTTVNVDGKMGFERIDAVEGASPVLIGINDNGITFAVDVTQASPAHRVMYRGNTWKLDSGLILTPAVVRALKLYDGPEEMGYMIPKGSYPLNWDGNIAYWTFKPPIKN